MEFWSRVIKDIKMKFEHGLYLYQQSNITMLFIWFHTEYIQWLVSQYILIWFLWGKLANFGKEQLNIMENFLEKLQLIENLRLNIKLGVLELWYYTYDSHHIKNRIWIVEISNNILSWIYNEVV